MCVLYVCVCRFGDRLLSVEGQEFRGVTRKEAVEVLRSCDQLSLVVEVARALPYNKPQHLVGLTTAYIYVCVHIV